MKHLLLPILYEFVHFVLNLIFFIVFIFNLLGLTGNLFGCVIPSRNFTSVKSFEFNQFRLDKRILRNSRTRAFCDLI